MWHKVVESRSIVSGDEILHKVGPLDPNDGKTTLVWFSMVIKTVSESLLAYFADK